MHLGNNMLPIKLYFGHFIWVFHKWKNPLFRAGTRNNLLTGRIIAADAPSNARLICIFLSGFTGSAHCTVQYGTDPTYMNLPYSAESTETGTAGDTVSVVLRERLNPSTVYYYTVSTVSGDITVTVRGTFTSPQYSMLIFCFDSHPPQMHFALCTKHKWAQWPF